ncbi:uncharacterized protein CTRU02_214906 [Colletotrichum truncatum]|uniref:Uncharacterized protein n=1 Tax=Colletotrichum truncatum TaxID=5467 RepID=A0ACC3YE09_COLTU|nr:uncharacterized protein CTRU02_08340 [Colletotrichum truncatum]KAF6790211.1 hypothetical protein CTRU02_08340 [Colletotrichum truncatum]
MAKEIRALILVGGAIQLFLDDNQAYPLERSLEAIGVGLQAFRDELSAQHNFINTGTVCAGLLVCALNLLQSTSCTAQIQLLADLKHIPSAISSLALSPEHHTPICRVLEFLGILDMTSFILGRQAPSADIWKHLREAQDGWKEGRVKGVEALTGMPMSLLDIFADIPYHDRESLEGRFWDWPGEIGRFVQCQTWDCWRLAGILDVRRRKSNKKRNQYLTTTVYQEPESSIAPSTDIVLGRLMAAIDAVLRGVKLPQNQNLLIGNALVYPLMMASLEVPLLQSYPCWKKLLDKVRSYVSQRSAFNLCRTGLELLDEAWMTASDSFDLDKAARRKGVEVAIF